jgi:phytoene dehydrogenase-like protein
LDQSGGAVVIVNALDDIRHWPQRKTPEYRQKKRRVAEQLLARLEHALPGLRGHVRYSEVSSPRTYERYTRNSAGSGYGNLVLPDATPNLINHTFPVRNVSFLSAWISGSGYEATMGYARMLVRSAPSAQMARTGTDRSF